MGAALEITVASPALEGIEARIRNLAAGIADPRDMLAGLGAGVESQTRRRIEGGGPAPDGEDWPDWHPDYAKTRHGNQKKLLGEGEFLDSVQHAVDGDLVETGSNKIQAAIHQFGGGGEMAPGPAAVPAREWLGISRGNERDLDAILDRHFEGILREALA